MNKNNDMSPLHGITQNIPLPGFYPTVTLQLNVTRYQSEGVGRFVMVMREPTDQIELQREFVNTGSWDEIASGARKALEQFLINMAWLQAGTTHD